LKKKKKTMIFLFVYDSYTLVSLWHFQNQFKGSLILKVTNMLCYRKLAYLVLLE
jgi:hypothetical protein